MELPLWLARFGRRQKAIHKVAEPSACQQLFALTLSGFLVVSAALREWFGEAGVILAAALAGLI
jgi:uncharacterized membrane protein (DUF4010 family)